MPALHAKFDLPSSDRRRTPSPVPRHHHQQQQQKQPARRSTVGEFLLAPPATGFPTLHKPPYLGSHPSQRWNRPNIHLYLRITATSEKRDLSHVDKVRRRSLKRRSIFPFNRDSDGLHVHSDGTYTRDDREFVKLVLKRHWLEDFQLGDFRPLTAPFIPILVRILVISIENHCKEHGWDVMVEPWRPWFRKGQMHATSLVQRWQDEKTLEALVSKMDVNMQIATLRAFLSAFKVKPLHFNKQTLKALIKKPLYDQFLRPNAEIKSIVLRTALPKARTELDTLAFLMTHIIHAWESSPNPLLARIQLADIYGPLLISFTDRPIIIDRDVQPNKTEEAAILEVIMDLCDAQFWNNLSMLLMNCAFRPLGQPKPIDLELQRNMQTSIVPLPPLPRRPSELLLQGSHSTDLERVQFMCSQLRSTRELLNKTHHIRLALASSQPILGKDSVREIHPRKTSLFPSIKLDDNQKPQFV